MKIQLQITPHKSREITFLSEMVYDLSVQMGFVFFM